MDLPKFQTLCHGKRITFFCVAAVLSAVLLSVAVCGYDRISKERQAVVDHCRTHLATVISKDAVTYTGYSFEHRMNRYTVCYDAREYSPDVFDKEDEIPKLNGVFYVEKDASFPIYHVFTQEDLTGDSFEGDVKGFMIADDVGALAFADRLIMNADDSFCCDVYPYTEVLYHSAKQYYTVTRSDDSQNGYTVELWVNQSNTLLVKNACVNQQPISAAFVTDDDDAVELADHIMCTAYQDVPYIYPDVTVKTESPEEWIVTRNDKESDPDGKGISVKITADGTRFELIWHIE